MQERQKVPFPTSNMACGVGPHATRSFSSAFKSGAFAAASCELSTMKLPSIFCLPANGCSRLQAALLIGEAFEVSCRPQTAGHATKPM